MDKDARKIVKAAISRGWVATRRTKHLQLRSPGGTGTVIFGTGSDYRSLRNNKADIRRIERAEAALAAQRPTEEAPQTQQEERSKAMPATPATPAAPPFQYLAVPDTQRGCLSWALMLRMLDTAPDALWCADDTEARGLSAIHFESHLSTSLVLRMLRRIEGIDSVEAFVGGRWKAPPALHEHSKCWARDGVHYADWNPQRKAWRIYRRSTPKPTYITQVRSLSREECIVMLDNGPPFVAPVGAPVESAPTESAPVEVTSAGVDIDAAARTAAEKSGLLDPEQMTDEALIAEVLHRLGGESGTLGGYTIRLAPVTKHMAHPNGGYCCGSKRGTVDPGVVVLQPADVRDVNCSQCKVSPIYKTVLWAMGGN